MLIKLIHYNLTTKRLTAFVLDLWLITMMFAASDFSLTYLATTWGFTIWKPVYSIIPVLLLATKDLLYPQGSLGKKIMGIQVVVEADNLPVLRKVLRNLTLFSWPVEAVVFLFIKKRLGDVMFYTKVVEQSHEIQK